MQTRLSKAKFVLVLWVVAGVLLLSGASASAGVFHLVSSFGSEVDFPEVGPTSVAVGVSGDVFVRDNGHQRVDVFNAEGTEPVTSITAELRSPCPPLPGGGPCPPLPESGAGLAVDDSVEVGDPARGYVYVVDNPDGLVDRFRPRGLSPGEGYEEVEPLIVPAPTGVAVDAKGDVYVTSFSPHAVHVFSPAGEELFEVESKSAPGLTAPFGIAVDSKGHVYVRNSETNVVKLTIGSLGELIEEQEVITDTSPSRAVAVDATGNVYVVVFKEGAYRVAQYTSGGELVEDFGAGEMGLSNGLAFSPANSDLYVADQGNHEVHIFAGKAGPPPPVVEGCGSLTSTPVTASITCSLIPNAETVEWRLEYGEAGHPLALAPGGKHQVVTSEPAKALEVTEPLEGLKPNTLYRYKLVAHSENGGGSEEGSFKTPPAVKSIGACTASSIGNETATLKAQLEPTELRPGEGAPTSWVFQYAPVGSSEFKLAPQPQGSTTTTGEVQTQVKGLNAHQAYHCRLSATTEYNNTPYTETGSEGQYTTPGPPQITEEHIQEVTLSTATVIAQVNPEGFPEEQLPATYWVQYGTTSASEHQAPIPLQPNNLPTLIEGKPAHGAVTASLTLTGLEPDTTYHYQLLAKTTDGETQGPEQTFNTNPPSTTALPDGRVYEMVTPPENHDANIDLPSTEVRGFFTVSPEVEDVNVTALPFQAAAGGAGVAYVGEPEIGGNGNTGPGLGNQYVARRVAPGVWVQQNLQPPGYRAPHYQAFSSDLSVGVLESCEATGPETPVLAPGAPGEKYDVLYSHATTAGGGYHALFDFPTPLPGTGPAEFAATGVTSNNLSECAAGSSPPAFAGASAGLGHLLFEVDAALVPGAPVGAKNNLYDSVDGRLYLVNVLPGSPGRAVSVATFGAREEFEKEELRPDFSGVVSRDGSRVFWTDLEAGSERVYVREDDGGSGARTVAVSGGPARYWTATPDGRYAFYTEGGGLWRFDTFSEVREELAGAGAGVQGVIGASEDGSHVYFVADGKLSGPNIEGKSPVAGEPNLYLFNGGAVTFIATLAAGPEQDDEIPPFAITGLENGGDWRPGLGNRTAEVTPDGEGIVFMSRRPLTGYRNTVTFKGTTIGVDPVQALSEVFVYDAGSGRLSCASCSPGGEPPRENVRVPEPFTAGFLPTSHSDTYLPRWISADGARVFFDSTQSLVPRDVNGKMDVYEWERDGAGSCREARGCVYLLSGGTGATGSWLLDASESGDDVFIITASQLAAQDHNEGWDVYDARVGGAQPVSSSVCTGTGCQGVPPAPPLFSTPASVTFDGTANYPPATQPPTTPTTPHVVKHKPLTRVQLLARALRACARKPRGAQRRCEAQAHKRYAAKTKASGSSRGRGR